MLAVCEFVYLKEKKVDLLALLPHLSAQQMGRMFYNSLKTVD